MRTKRLVAVLALSLFSTASRAEEPVATPVDASTIRGKVFCGYQGWFRCPGDADGGGWVHWSRRVDRLDEQDLTFEMWPDVAELGGEATSAAPGFVLPDGKPSRLFSAATPRTVLRHFEWMRTYGIDGAFLQHFFVDLPGGPFADREASRRRVLESVAKAAEKTGRGWAISFDLAGMPADAIFDLLTTEWRRLVAERVVERPGYLHEAGKPVVQVWGFYRDNASNRMTPSWADRLIDFFKAEGPLQAYLMGGGDWNWREAPADWRAFVLRFDAYSPWNIGNWSRDEDGLVHASTGWWRDDKALCEAHGVFWLPVVYPGFGWDNLTRRPSGSSSIPGRGGAFYWKQFHQLAGLGASSACVAMFDEVDEGTAVYKVTNEPPRPGRFLTFEGLPSDWYNRLTGEGAKVVRGERTSQAAIPIPPRRTRTSLHLPARSFNPRDAMTFLLLMSTALLAVPLEAPSLEPVAPSTFHVAPDAPATLEWKRSGTLAGEPLDYRVRDYRGSEETEGKAVAAAGGVRIERAFPQGYHEIEFPSTSQRFGVLALPKPDGTPDPFFAMDAGLSWLVQDDEARDELVAFAKGAGFAMMRERLTWGAIEPAVDRWDWQSGARFERLRESYHRAGIPILEISHDAPAWAGRVGKYPRDLPATAAAWQAVGRRWDRFWGGVEIWNEPEISFGADMPGDQYTAYGKAVSFGLRRAGTHAPIVGGVMSHYTPEFLRTCVESGMLERVDAFSFHDYGPALAFEDVNARFREWLRASGHGDMPLWITECGWPWKRGPERPPADQDRGSASQIVMKAVEARACGVERFFTFVYPFYEENTSNFSVMDRCATPLRSVAAYAQAIHALKGLSYRGDLRRDDPRLTRARVFADNARAVAVLYSTAPEAELREPIRLDAVPSRVEAADGRATPIRDGRFSLDDGLAFAWFDAATIAPLIEPQSRAKGLNPGLVRVARAEPSPIVLRHRFDPAVATPTSMGYHLKAGVTVLPVVVEVINLGDATETLDVSLKIGRPKNSGDPIRRVQVGPRSEVDVEWKVDAAGAFADFAPLRVFVTARSEKSERDRLSLAFLGEPKLEQALAHLGRSERLPIEDLDRWSDNIGQGGKMRMEAAKPAGWHLVCEHAPKADRWVYPYFRLPNSVDLIGAQALVVRARSKRPGDVRFFLWEGETGVGYINGTSLIPADGEWHVTRLDLDALDRSNANAPDPNSKLDRGLVRKISVGLNSDVDAGDLEVSDLYVAW
ncbi:hypothetical protein [Paludisphaera mucosa]|uniref:Asl1-like glycosyl hydrolase catalytic domain-containing protein n=1 Tax=Paludisphaera mucosa TaxID=3030827 RepID=A0ABT6F7N1_9BACT|nr:hypothetical protein [Paludisphaera mucosa]MDG3003418.1 hypothetical protein [Paludisphaera mucosa]